MAKSKCKWCKDAVVLNEECTKIIRRFICDIDSYDSDVGCNKDCNYYQRKKEVAND